jgi:hypothetical protein
LIWHSNQPLKFKAPVQTVWVDPKKKLDLLHLMITTTAKKVSSFTCLCKP